MEIFYLFCSSHKIISLCRKFKDIYLHFVSLHRNMPVAVYDGCGSVAFVYWLRVKQFCSSHEGSVPFMAVTVCEIFEVWGCLVVVFAALLCLCVQ